MKLELKIIMLLGILFQSCTKDAPIVLEKQNVIVAPITTPAITPTIIIDTMKSKLQEGLISYHSFSNNLLDSSQSKFNSESYHNVKFTTDRFGNQNSAILTKDGFVSVFKKESIVASFQWSELQNRWHWNPGENERWKTPIQFDRDDTGWRGNNFNGIYVWQYKNGYKFSVSLWIKIEDEIEGRILSCEAQNMETKKEFGNFNIVYTKNGNVKIHTGEDINIKVPTKEWINITYTYDNRSEKVYLNSKLIVDKYNNSRNELSWNTIQYKYTSHYRVPMGIGGKALNGMDNFYGSIDDVRVYNRILNIDEINYINK